VWAVVMSAFSSNPPRSVDAVDKESPGGPQATESSRGF
jgi:hypothetical protein